MYTSMYTKKGEVKRNNRNTEERPTQTARVYLAIRQL